MRHIDREEPRVHLCDGEPGDYIYNAPPEIAAYVIVQHPDQMDQLCPLCLLVLFDEYRDVIDRAKAYWAKYQREHSKQL